MKRFQNFLSILFLIGLVFTSQNAKAAEDKNKAMPWVPFLLLNQTVTMTISGKATIPNYTPAGSLALVVDGLNGSVCGGGMSDRDGNFSIKATITKDIKRVLVYAVDPNNPEYYVTAYIDLDENNKSNGLSWPESAGIYKSEPPKNSDITINIDAGTLAESLVSDYSGLGKKDFSQEELDAVFTLSRALTEGTYSSRLCSQEQDLQIDSLLTSLSTNRNRAPSIPAIRKIIDSYVQQPGDLITRVRRAQEYATNSITSSNYKVRRGAPATVGLGAMVLYGLGYLSGPVGWSILGISAVGIAYTETSVNSVRNKIKRFDIGSLRAEQFSWISQSELEAAIEIIFTSGYGNCQEKGLVGAYIASRFDEFEQVAHIVSLTDKYSIGGAAEHSFSIACTGKESVYDIENLLSAKIYNGLVNPPQEFYSAGCYLVDPWAGKVELLTKEMVASERWQNLSQVMKVSLEDKRNASPELSYSANSVINKSSFSKAGQTCPEDLVCNTCTSDSYLESTVCKSFIPPVAGNDKKYYLFKRSGSGYRKKWGGWSDRFTGYDYFYQYILPSDAEAIKDAYSKFQEATANACDGGPALCPCAPYPDIWVEGKVEVVGIFDTVEELDPFRCDNHHYGPYYLICNMWNLESAPYPGYWPAINGVCGD